MLYQMPKCYPHDEAEKIAAQLQADDEDGWTYTPKRDPKGGPNSIIEVREADGYFIGYWSI